MRDYGVVKIVAEPGNAGFEAESAESLVADGAAVVFLGFFKEGVPEGFEMGCADEGVEGGNAGGRTVNDADGDSGELRFGGAELGERIEIRSAEGAENFGAARAFDAEGGEAVGGVIESDVVHDDVAIEFGGEFFADEAVGDDEVAVGDCVDFELAENVTLGIEEESGDAGRVELFGNLVGEDGVEVAAAVGTGEFEVAAIIFVDQGGGFAGKAVFGFE